MSLTWAVELPGTSADAAQTLRLAPGVEARLSDDGNSLWLRGRELDQETRRLVWQLPCRRRFTLLEDGRAVPEGATVPVMTMLGKGWVPLRHFGSLELPVSKRPGPPPQPAPVRLVPAKPEASPSLVVVRFAEWRRYAITAPAVRLAPLRFAVSEDGRAAIQGTPLPPLLGTFYTVEAGIAVPAGRELAPALPADLLARHFKLEKGDILLFRLDGGCEFLAGTGFASAARSAVRATAQFLENPAAP